MNALTLPDIAAQTPAHAQTLDWVGMQGIALPINLAGQRIHAHADVGVSLDDGNARGIHMSRLYLALHALEQCELNTTTLQQLLNEFLDSHQDLSQQASIALRGEALLSRPALVSPLAGWKSYPFEVRARQDIWGFHVELQVEVAYSSTCPCSAALARQLIQQRFIEDFADQPLDHAQLLAWLGSPQGIVATPHSQRSYATLQVRLHSDSAELPLVELIDAAEQALGTAVQTAVKRADEQAFALANGQNLMFCEDAARRLHSALREQPAFSAFQLRVVHAESLHAHDAVAVSCWNWSPA
ncbi:GTP cyclohydrolase FolE2 [Pseudomonas anguilliseptica]|uniref:GTP cyclohydrolase FolE2 n=1 Tax=Pseudomonas anguilliseptica TaxID=53406 RepID=A0A1H4VD06_PSEAG|nr:GTP cyclohydrolase FolE2 [Pseudomonas anguilliseptica]SEC78959.1 GTP cyclohydrolase I [Pseudomonas anguilliseptica]